MTTRLMRLVARLRADRRGLTSLEFGFIALPLTLLLFGVVEVGMAIRAKTALQYATTQAARCAVVNTALCGTEALVKSYAVTQSMGLPVSTSTFSVANATCGKQVSASVPFPVVAHAVFPTALNLTASACHPI